MTTNQSDKQGVRGKIEEFCVSCNPLTVKLEKNEVWRSPQEAADAIIELIDRDVIGENDEQLVPLTPSGPYTRSEGAEIRNQLRAEQRARLKGEKV